MAFNTVQDYHGLADGTTLACKASNDNASAQVVDAPMNDKGDVPAQEVLATLLSPSNDYELLAAWARGAENTPNPVKLGGLTTVGSKAFILTQLQINTGGGTPPAISASGVQVKGGASEGDVYEIPAFSVAFVHRALVLWGAFTLGGTGCHLTTANYTASVQPSRGTVNGNVVSHDVENGRIVVNITISQVGDTEPTLAAGTGWKITSPLTKSKGDAQYPTWTASLTMLLTKKVPAQQASS